MALKVDFPGQPNQCGERDGDHVECEKANLLSKRMWGAESEPQQGGCGAGEQRRTVGKTLLTQTDADRAGQHRGRNHDRNGPDRFCWVVQGAATRGKENEGDRDAGPEDRGGTSGGEGREMAVESVWGGFRCSEAGGRWSLRGFCRGVA